MNPAQPGGAARACSGSRGAVLTALGPVPHPGQYQARTGQQLTGAQTLTPIPRLGEALALRQACYAGAAWALFPAAGSQGQLLGCPQEQARGSQGLVAP